MQIILKSIIGLHQCKWKRPNGLNIRYSVLHEIWKFWDVYSSSHGVQPHPPSPKQTEVPEDYVIVIA